jgi:NAD(P)-dependent dehydrogenase (short-subunit alcohol dehydrogenase family)
MAETSRTQAGQSALPSQEGRTAIVTGANAGIGLWTAIGLAKAGAQVVMVCRDSIRGEDARSLISKMSKNKPDLIVADFASLKAVHEAAGRILDRHQRIDILVNNAGLFSPRRELTADGYEMTIAVNHLAPFLLTNTLLPALERSGQPGRNARIVNVASEAANRASIDLGDLMSSRRYSMMAAYGQSKLANILFTKELARRLPPRPVSANCLHPGVVATGIGDKGGVFGFGWSMLKPALLTPEKGAANSLYVATSPAIEGVSGAYFVKQKPARPNPIADDPMIARRLWTESEKLIERALSGGARVVAA